MRRRPGTASMNPMTTFVVERYLVGWTESEVEGLLHTLERHADDLAHLGVHHLRSILVPGDETCWSLFEATDADIVERCNRDLGLPVDRVVTGRDVPAEYS